MTDLSRNKRFLQAAVFITLLLAAALMLGYLAHEHRGRWDMTQNARHSLSGASLEVLKQMTGPVKITAYATTQDANLGDLQQIIRDFFEPYRRAKPDLLLDFVDPTVDPKLAQAAKVQANGEMVVEYAGKSEHLVSLNEESVANLLIRLSRQQDRLVFALTGHGERKLDGIANFDLGQFGRELKKKGFRVSSLNLAMAQEVPANANLLLITSPQVDLLPGEIDKITAFVDRGGNLLWLIDQDSISGGLHGLQPLVDKLELSLSPGIVIDPAANKLKAPATWALAALYGPHPVTRNFNLITVFPFARQIGAGEKSSWHATPLVEVAQNGWIATGDPRRGFDKMHDIPGPVTIAMALERSEAEKNQRVAVVGTGEFLANMFIGNGGNLDFGVNLVNWIASDEKLIALSPRATIDGSLMLGKTTAIAMAIGLLFVLPGALLLAAAVIGWRRRKS